MMYNDESEKITDGEKIDDLKPGDGASFEFKVKNTYPSSSDVEIDDVDVTIEDDNNDLDIDEEESLGTIRENDDDSESISIDLDDDLDEDIYDLFIRVIGYDEFGARHGEQVTVKIEIEKEDDDVALKRADLNPDSVNNCDTRSVTLTLSIDNIGKHDQDGASLTVESTGLGYYNTIDQIELDEDEAKTKRFSIPISSDTKPGAYTFLITARTEDGKITDEDYMSILVTNCGSPTTTTPPATTTGSDVQLISGSGYTGITTAQTVVSGNDEEVSDDGEGILSIPALIILLVLVVVTIVLLTLILIKK